MILRRNFLKTSGMAAAAPLSITTLLRAQDTSIQNQKMEKVSEEQYRK
jgi:hypothetical protein